MPHQYFPDEETQVYTRTTVPIIKSEIPKRRSTAGRVTGSINYTTQKIDTEDFEGLRPISTPRSSHPLTLAGIGMLIVLIAIVVWMCVIAPFFSWLYIHWHYGDHPISYLNTQDHHMIGEVVNGRVMVYDVVTDNPDRSKVFMLQLSTDGRVVAFTLVNPGNNEEVYVSTDNNGAAYILYEHNGTFDTTKWCIR